MLKIGFLGIGLLFLLFLAGCVQQVGTGLVGFPPMACGNGNLELQNNEQCDDGNTNNGDGCSQNCQIESGATCTTPPSRCEPEEQSQCGNGELQTPLGEQCDDGDRENGDGCSSTCLIEDGWVCTTGPSRCRPATCGLEDNFCPPNCHYPQDGDCTFCGDGTRQQPNNDGVTEECDDGNNADGDGCSSACRVEQPVECGDSVPEGNEQCDCGSDGNCTVEELDNQTCSSQGFPLGGTLSCYPSGSAQACQFNTNNCQQNACRNDDGICPAGCTPENDNDCVTPTCNNNGVKEGTEECDGTDFGSFTGPEAGIGMCNAYGQANGQHFNAGSLKCTSSCTIDTGLCKGYEGFGSQVLGGSSQRVVHVTTLEDNATTPIPGSLRAAVCATGQTCTSWNTVGSSPASNAYVVFDVTGTIQLANRLSIAGNNITLDGFSARSPGITIINRDADTTGIEIAAPARNIIVQGLRFKGHFSCPVSQQQSHSCTQPSDNDRPISIEGNIGSHLDWSVEQITFGYNTFTASSDSNPDFWGRIRYATFSNNFSHHTWDATAVSHHGSNPIVPRNFISVHHNVFAKNNQRTPRVRGANYDTDVVNNIVFQWSNYNNAGEGTMIDHVRGEMETLPDGSRIPSNSHRVNIMNNYFDSNYRVNAGLTRSYWHEDLYIGGNRLPAGANEPDDNRSTPNPRADPYQITTQAATDLCNPTLNNAGSPYKTADEESLLSEIRARLGCGQPPVCGETDGVCPPQCTNPPDLDCPRTAVCGESDGVCPTNCTNPPDADCPITPFCGNNIQEGAEECDDGCLQGTPNVCEPADNGDGCSSQCQIEETIACGDGAIEGNESCDDNNTNNGDGCSSICAIEPGWECTGQPSICTRITTLIIYADNSILNNCTTYNPLAEEGAARCVGGSGHAYSTIQEAARNAVTPGMIVYIRQNDSGNNLKSYREQVQITNSGAPNQRISFQGYPGERPVICGNFNPQNYDIDKYRQICGVDPGSGANEEFLLRIMPEVNYILLKGLEVAYAKGTSTGDRGYGIIVQGSYNRIEDVIAHHNMGGNFLSGKLKAISANGNAQYNEFEFNESYQSCMEGGFTVEPTTKYTLFRNNLTYRNGYMDTGTTPCEDILGIGNGIDHDGFIQVHSDCRGGNCANNEFTDNIILNVEEDGFDNSVQRVTLIRNIVYNVGANGQKVFDADSREFGYRTLVQNVFLSAGEEGIRSYGSNNQLYNTISAHAHDRGLYVFSQVNEARNNVLFGNGTTSGCDNTRCIENSAGLADPNNWQLNTDFPAGYTIKQKLKFIRDQVVQKFQVSAAPLLDTGGDPTNLQYFNYRLNQNQTMVKNGTALDFGPIESTSGGNSCGAWDGVCPSNCGYSNQPSQPNDIDCMPN